MIRHEPTLSKKSCAIIEASPVEMTTYISQGKKKKTASSSSSSSSVNLSPLRGLSLSLPHILLSIIIIIIISGQQHLSYTLLFAFR